MAPYDAIARDAAADRLAILGAFHPGVGDGAPEGTGTLLLLGPVEPGFWNHVSSQPEFADGRPDPLDRWSRRVISAFAKKLGAQPVFPFGGPPYQPFIPWALRSGRTWRSPVGLLVHDTAGLMVSFRGALALDDRIGLPGTQPRPCADCDGQPCRTACPVNALLETHYDLAACHGYLDTDAGTDCLTQGCAARRACPVSRSYGRLPAQSAFHMKAFHR